MCLAVAGLVALALVFAGPWTYEALARDTPFAPARFHFTDRGTPRTIDMPVEVLLAYHGEWLAYVTGWSSSEPGTGPGGSMFTPDERAHMSDVRHVFIGFEVAAVVGAVVGGILLARAGRRGREAAITLARDASIAAGAGAAAIAIVAGVAFDPLFLAFHEVFFPQGNFLFGPESNLIAMYPDAYWYGVTLRVGSAFVAVMAAIAIAAAATLRQARR
ncbi:MAG TPA: DUF1461 domain-containing protein [Candidatus Limnocylindria bacterium]